MRAALGFVTVLFAFAACARADSPSRRPVPPERAPAVATTPPETPATHPRVLRVAVLPAQVSAAEDGRGNMIAAHDPVAIEITADDWGGRALDPVLSIGALHFHHYEHPTIGVIRFVVAERALLPAGAEASMQWGDDVGSRIVVSAALPVPR